MNSSDTSKFLHDLRNCLNSATLNARLIRRQNAADIATIDRLEAALRDAEKLTSQFQKHLPAHSSNTSPVSSQSSVSNI